ncbi:MAG TPA: alpha/beta hydrolase [Longimicrobiales bacterium]
MTTATLERNHGTFEGVRRLRLHYLSWEVPTPRAAVVSVHGFSDHGGRYESFGEILAGFGFSTFALDLRGHGRSDGRRGFVPRFEIYLQELDRFRREVQGLVAPDCPLILVGHSMGGLIALRYLEEFETPFRGAVLASPWLGTAMPVPRWKVLLANLLNRALPALPVRARLRAEHLCHDSAVVTAYREDPLVHDTMTPRLFTEASTAMGLVHRRADRLRVPLLFLIAGDDRIVDAPRALRFARALPGDVTVHIFDGCFHELFFEPDRAPVFDTLRRWLDERLG